MSSSSADHGAEAAREGKDSGTIARDLEETRSELDETLGQLQARLSPRQMFDRTVASVRDNTRAVAGNLSGSVRQNPLPLMIVGAGLFWMIAARGRRFRIGSRGATRAARRAEAHAGRAVSGAGTRAASTVRAGLSGAADTLRDSAGALSDRLSVATRSVQQQAESAAEDLSGLFERRPLLTSALTLVLAAAVGYALTAAESPHPWRERAR